MGRIYSPRLIWLLRLNRKSQIAIEYAYRLREKSPATSVFWVYANNTARFEQSYRNIAIAAKIPGLEDPKADILNLVFEWLGSNESGDWLLILDNAEDTDVFFSPSISAAAQNPGLNIEPPCLSEYLPQTGTGSILITSRDEATAIRLTGAKEQVLQIRIMSEIDTHALLNKKLPDDPSDRTAKQQLIMELDFIPLAITQATAYIAIRSLRMTIAKYLQLLQRGEENQIHLLSQNEVDLRRCPGVPNSVIRTWQISFLKIKERKAAAANLLSRMCFLDRQGIPEFLFYDENGELSLDFEEEVEMLIKFSFVTTEKERKTFTIHRLVQLATTNWITIHGEIGEVGRIQEHVLGLVWRHYPDGEYEDWKKCELLEPHAQIVSAYTFDSKNFKLQQASILHKNAWYAIGQGRFKISEEKNSRALTLRKSCLRVDHPATLASLSLLAKTYFKEGYWDKAEKLEVEVLEKTKRVLKADHPDTLTSMANLALTYWNQGRWDEAVDLIRSTIELQKNTIGKDHPYTVDSIRLLEEWSSTISRYGETEPIAFTESATVE